jgi:hypothetical protein
MVEECARKLSAMPARYDCSSSSLAELDKYCTVTQDKNSL